jgi:hypothetical protein
MSCQAEVPPSGGAKAFHYCDGKDAGTGYGKPVEMRSSRPLWFLGDGGKGIGCSHYTARPLFAV